MMKKPYAVKLWPLLLLQVTGPVGALFVSSAAFPSHEVLLTSLSLTLSCSLCDADPLCKESSCSIGDFS